MKLVMAPRGKSSWALRPFLILKYYNIPFDEIHIDLYGENSKTEILKYSPNGKVPCLLDENYCIWDSLSIAEYLNEKYSEKQMWPKDLEKRIMARSISAEMHSGFQDLRTHMSYDLSKKLTNYDGSKCSEDIKRINSIWNECLNKFGGPFLLGDFSIADAMYAPVVDRFISYGVPFESEAIKNYASSIRNLPGNSQWRSDFQ